MSSLRGRLRHLQKAARGKLAWLDLPDGSSFYYDPGRTAIELFSYGAQGLRAVHVGSPELPEPPEVLKVIGALPSREDRGRAFREVYGGSTNPFAAFDIETFLESGVIVKHPGYERTSSAGPYSG